MCSYQYSCTEQALDNVTEQINKSIDKSEISLLVILDLFIAFDRVKVKGKVFYGQGLAEENLLPQNVGSIINYLQ